jgi:hypothetical protein
MDRPLWNRIARIFLIPLRRFIVLVLAPITDTKEFKALYPVLVVSLGALAAFHTDEVRGVVVVVAFSIIAFVSLITIVLDARRIKLESRWNLLFFSYYRPSLMILTNKIARSLDGHQRLDILTYRTGDFVSALDEAAVDFEQVSGLRTVNIASFDIEYVSMLKSGIVRGGSTYKLVPLSDFWPGKEMYELPDRMPAVIRRSVLQRLDPDNLYALPLGWGMVGVGIFSNDLSGEDISELLTIRHGDRKGFDFRRLFEHLNDVTARGYQVLCYDFWSSIGQLVSLNYTGHMGISQSEEQVVAAAFAELRRVLPRENIIADPVLLLGRVKALDKAVVIGGSTWLGLRGTLLPLAIPDAPPVYGAFCECLGILAQPQSTDSELWERDAATLMLWLAEQLGDQRQSTKVAGTSILRNYFPAFLSPSVFTSRFRREGLDVHIEQPMQIDSSAEIMFRQFSISGSDALSRVKELWSKTSGS